MIRCVVLGGGMAGLAAAFRLQQAAAHRPLSVRIVEAQPRFGGKVVSESEQGFLLEAGPDSFVAHKPACLELARQVGLGDRLIGSRDADGGVSIFQDHRLQPLPEGFRLVVPGRWRPFFRSPLLTWRGKLRVACEPWIPKGPAEGDESLGMFIRRRLGQEALERVAEPMLAHIHVADVDRMSLLATYPRLRQMEQCHGSLVRAFRAVGRPAGPLFWSFPGGVAELTDRLAERLPEACKLSGRTARRLSRHGDGSYRVHLDDEVLEADAVVLALPAFAASTLMDELAPPLAETLRTLRYVSLATLSLGYRRRDLPKDLRGFGFFVPKKAQREVLAATWCSTKFVDRAPTDHALLRVFLAENEATKGALELPDEILFEAVGRDLKRLTGVEAQPTLRRLYRWPRGYPQYEVGHAEILQRAATQLPGSIFLAGSAFHGVGLPDCIQSGFAAADAILKGVS